MNKVKGIFFVMGIVLFLCACASSRSQTMPSVASASPPKVVVLPPLDDASLVEKLIVYAERIRWLGPAQLEAERSVVEHDYQRDPVSFNRVRLALLFSLRRAPFRDDTRARELLSQAAKETEPGSQPFRSFAMWWLQELDDRWSGERIVEDERRQRQALQKKLEQLKAIEEEMDRRVPPVVAPRL